MNDATIAEGLADRIQSVTFDGLSHEAVHWAKVAVLDTVGCTLAGAHEDCARIVGRAATFGTSGGECLVFGSNHRVGPLDAALINGTAAHALDYDDCSNTLGGHPSAPVVPALFALGEIHKVTGKQFLAAYVAGWEAETRIPAASISIATKKAGTPPRPWGSSDPPPAAPICWVYRSNKPGAPWRWQRHSHPASKPISAP